MSYSSNTTTLFNNQEKLLPESHEPAGLSYEEILAMFDDLFGAAVKLGFYRNKEAPAPAKFVNWQDLLAMAEKPSIGPKADAACLSQHDGNGKTAEAARTAKFSIIAIDYDNGLKPFNEVCWQWSERGLNFLAFTTASHTENLHKIKVLLPLAQAVTAEEWLPVARGLAVLVGADPAQTRPAQVFFAPNKLTADSDYQILHQDWRTEFSPDHPLWNQAVTAFEESRRAAEAKATPKPRNSSQPNIIGLINDAYDIGAPRKTSACPPLVKSGCSDPFFSLP